MADSAQPATERGGSLKRNLLIGLVVALSLGGGGFYAIYSGRILAAESPADLPPSVSDIAFVPLEPIIIGIEAGGETRHLRFAATLEVARAHRDDVRHLLPRISDVLNSFLRAVDLGEVGDPTRLVRLRAQMLRRVRIVSGEGRVRDLLINEFVLN